MNNELNSAVEIIPIQQIIQYQSSETFPFTNSISIRRTQTDSDDSPGLDCTAVVRPDTAGHLVRLDGATAVGLDVVVPVLLLLAAPASLGRLPAPRPQGPAPLARL